jgi:hypothetical protein
MPRRCAFSSGGNRGCAAHTRSSSGSGGSGGVCRYENKQERVNTSALQKLDQNGFIPPLRKDGHGDHTKKTVQISVRYERRVSLRLRQEPENLLWYTSQYSFSLTL